MEVNPLNIFFVKSDSKGDRLLFRYPYTTENKDENKKKKFGRNNSYAVSTAEDLLQNPQSQTSNIDQGQLSGFTDEMLSTLFAVKAELCNRKFELKVNDVRFVGHPTLLPYRTNKDDTAAMILINIVFALKASASHSIVKCYHDLSKRLGKALRYEERRCSYLTQEMKIMMAAHDEVSTLDSEIPSVETVESELNSRHSFSSTTNADLAPKSAFHLILQRSSLARSMKSVFEELTETGIVQVRINKWVLLSFCLPHKAHQAHNRGLIVEPETIDKCLEKLKPYHGILLLVSPNELLASIPLDGCAALVRLIKMYSPLKSLQTLAIEADLTLKQAFQLTGHLVYWAKATVMYPLCEGNVYVVAPRAAVCTERAAVVDAFRAEFPGLCLLQLLSEFSLPAPLWYLSVRGGACGGARLARVLAWLLQRRLLLQLHTYVQFNPPQPERDGREYFCEKHDGYNPSASASLASLAPPPLHVPEPLEPRSSTNMFPDSDEDCPTENNLNQTDFSHTQPIVIESDHMKYFKLAEADSANHSFDDGADVVDGLVRASEALDDSTRGKTAPPSSVDSGIAHAMAGADGADGADGGNTGNGHSEHTNGDKDKESDKKSLTSRLSDVSLKEADDGIHRDASSDEDRCDDDVSPRNRNGGVANGADRKNGISLNLRLQTEMGFAPPAVWNLPPTPHCEAPAPPPAPPAAPPAAPPTTQAILDTFTREERAALAAVPAASNMDDLLVLAQLHKKGYFRGEHHLEEIMFQESMSRPQLLQLLDKFKDVLITYETEDPAVAMLYPYQ